MHSPLRHPLLRYYYAMVDDPRGSLVETSIQLLAILLDYTPPGDLMRRQRQRQMSMRAQSQSSDAGGGRAGRASTMEVEGGMANLFCSFVSRLQMSEVCMVHVYKQYNTTLCL